MPTFLLTWNPKKWNWKSLEKDIETVRAKGKKRDTWSVGITKRITEGDRVFLMKLGEPPRGMIASGWVQSETFSDKHWDIEARKQGKDALYVSVVFDTILEPNHVLRLDHLKYSIPRKMHWTPQSSGILIPTIVADELEKVWAEFTNQPVTSTFINIPEEIEGKTFREGSARPITVNAYERNAEARMLCIRRYGPICSVCGFDFKKFYGDIGNGFIHVHHLKSLSEIGKNYELDPIKDLRPVCPNCHAMLHKRKPAHTIEELKQMIRKPV